MKIVNPETLARPSGYNHGILYGNILFIAGQVGWDSSQKMRPGLVEQWNQALTNILEILKAAGGKAEDIGRMTIFVKDKTEYLRLRKEIGQVYRKNMGKHYPAMSLVEVGDLLEEGALVEIEATAVIGT